MVWVAARSVIAFVADFSVAERLVEVFEGEHVSADTFLLFFVVVTAVSIGVTGIGPFPAAAFLLDLHSIPEVGSDFVVLYKI
jgi:hypothetical protein